ncbi:MAG: ATP-binding protein [Candidatus Omnitrophota bacterium]
MHFTLCDFLSDIVQNAIEAEATLIIVDLIETEEKYKFLVADNGKGMDPETLSKVQSPFFTDGKKHTRAQGLGLSFLAQAVEQGCGTWDIRSEKNFGTSIAFTFDKSHVDTPPLGDVPQTLLQLTIFDGKHEFVVNRSRNDKKYTVIRNDLKKTLGDLSCAGNLMLAKKYISSLEQDIINP